MDQGRQFSAPGFLRWEWGPGGTAARVMEELGTCGTTWFHAPAICNRMLHAPWETTVQIVGRFPVRLEAVRIHCVQNDGFYVASNRAARLHFDPHPWGAPDVQIWVCVRPSPSGGETQFVDTWSILDYFRENGPDIFERLFREPRRMKNVDGPYRTPTFVLRRGSLVCMHSAAFDKDTDEVGRAFQERLEKERVRGITMREGDVIVNHNHRTLHGRTAFEGRDRELLRIAVWLAEPLVVPPRFLAAATDSDGARHAPEVYRRLGHVLANLARVKNSPEETARLEAVGFRPRLAEAWTDRVLDAALDALASVDP